MDLIGANGKRHPPKEGEYSDAFSVSKNIRIQGDRRERLNKSILVIEKDLLVNDQIREAWALHGYLVHPITTVTPCWNILSQVKVDGILLNIDRSSTENGLTVLSSLLEQYQAIPIIMMLQEGEEEMLLAGLSLGARDFLLKPMHSEYVVYKCHIHF